MRDLGALHERIRLSGVVQAGTGLRVGGQQGQDLTGSDLPVVKDAGGRPYLPGSSFKGALRATVEAMLRGLAGGAGRRPWACDPLDEDRRCGPKRDGERRGVPAPINDVLDSTCDACLLFGSPHLAGRLLVSDLPLVGDGRRAVEVRDCVAIDRDTETARDGGKYDLEVVPAGTAFELELVLDNPEDHQLGLLAAGLDALGQGYARLGGGGTRGLGRVEIRVERVQRRSARQMLGLEDPAPDEGWETLAERGRKALADLVARATGG